jgi:uncharacterized protein YxjI
MKRIKTYSQYNEEVSLKNILVGGALAASTLVGCDTQDLKDRESGKWGETEQTTTSSKELPNSFEMKEVIMTIGTDMNIVSDGQNYGKVEERTFNWGSNFEYFDNTGKKKATAKEKVMSWGMHIDIFDEKNNKIGSLEEEILKGFFSWKTYYKILDASDNSIGESEKLEFISTDIEIFSKSGESLCKIHRPGLNLIGDTWNVNITGNIDKRLVVFIPPYKTSADASESSSSDDDN